ncbi:DNA polymerase IV [Methylonatrum kenyense]|uniref:DNA polymerase IV n=1 Tax=Methylonatrum kenyense TaxID=455253 RepID=UPI0020BE07DF|nr:DNA polymerase IV [Methylonatrum kenyense]MCK8516858.1 DNA polymerase IV [Methylonatrum kenyense]
MASEQPLQRKIIHVDMDAFYAAIEQRDDPALRGRPVVVGGSPDGRGVVATCSYEARRFGIHSAMPAARAIRLCPDAVFLRPRFTVYRAVSRQIQALFRDYTDLVEPLSLDEAYLDVTCSSRFQGSAIRIARDIKARIRAETGLTASAGVSYNKFFAKQASDLEKPDGLTLIRPEQGAGFIASLPVGRIHGVGRATERRMHDLGIRTGADLRRWSLAELQQTFGRRAGYYYGLARGVDERPVRGERIRKSIGAEQTYPADLRDRTAMCQALVPLAEKVATALDARELQGHTLTLKVKFSDFRQITRARSRALPWRNAVDMLPVAEALLGQTEAGERPVRLLGLSVSSLQPREERVAEQMTLAYSGDR